MYKLNNTLIYRSKVRDKSELKTLQNVKLEIRHDCQFSFPQGLKHLKKMRFFGRISNFKFKTWYGYDTYQKV